MQKIFSQDLRFKDVNGSDFPEWVEMSLGDICTIKKGSILSKADISPIGTPCILYGELYTKYKDIIYSVISKTERVDDNMTIGMKNDVLIPASGESAIDISTASCLMVDNVILGGDLNIIRCPKMVGIFLSCILNHKMKYDIAKVAQGASVVHLYADNLRKLRVPVPSLKEQNAIAAFLSVYGEKIETEKMLLTHWQNIKKGLLQQMFV